MAQPAMLVVPFASRVRPQCPSSPSSLTHSASGHQRPTVAAEARKPNVLDQVREALRLRHYSLRTEDSYVHWIKRFILFHNKRHPQEMGEQEIAQFLSALAVDRQVSAATQNQALNALLLLYRHVLGLNPGWIDHVSAPNGPSPSRSPCASMK